MYKKMKIIGAVFIMALSLAFTVYGFQIDDFTLQNELYKLKDGYTAVQRYYAPDKETENNRDKSFNIEQTENKGFYTDNENTYYRDANGNNVTGWQFLTRDDGVDCWYYFDESGAMTTGFKTIDGQLYYFKNDGTLTHSCMQEIDGRIYSFSTDGHADLGWQSRNGYWYYFDRFSGDAYESNVHGIEGDDYIYVFWDNYFTRKDGSMGERGTLVIGNPKEYIYADGELAYVVDEGGHALVNQDIIVDGIEYTLGKNGFAEKKQPEQTIFEQKIEAIKNNFPINALWNHTGTNSPTSYTWRGGVGNEFSSSVQCNGFAKYLYYYVYGEVSNSVYEIGAPKISIAKVEVGDYVGLKGPDSDHSIFVTDIYEKDGVTYWKVAREVWGDSNNKIVTQTYRIENLTTLTGLTDGRTYTVKGIRRASNELRRNVGLPDAPDL